MRAILYPRISLEEGSPYGLPSQLRAMQEYVKAKGYQVIAELAEEYTGKTLDRPQLNRIREMARARQFDVLVAHSLDRLTRRMGQLAALRDELRAHQVGIECVLNPMDDSVESRVMQQMLEAFADYEREKIHERTLRGRKEKARRGLVVGGRVAYGYEYNGGDLRVIEERAAIVRRIFQALDAGESVRGIARRLTADGVPSWAGGRWQHSSVKKILANETYCGVAHYFARKREGKQVRMRPETDWIAIPAPAVISRELWERVQLKRGEKGRNAGRPTRRYLLRGLLYCSCGKRMCGDPGQGRYPRYRCLGRETACCDRTVRIEPVEQAAWEAVSTAFTDTRALRALVEANLEAARSEDGPVQAERLRKRIAALAAKEGRAMGLLLELPEARQDLKLRYQELREERRGLEAELGQIERAGGAADRALDSVGAIVDEAREAIAGLDQAERAEFLRRAVERITWTGEELEILCFLILQNGQNVCTIAPDCERFYFTLKARLAA